MSYRICVVEGDGIGREVIQAAIEVLQASGVALIFELADGGFECFQRRGTALPPETLALARACDATLFGATQSPPGKVDGYRSPILELRQELDLYANLRPVYSLPIPASRPGIDLIIVRENTECLYVRRERSDGDTAVAERVITRRASARIMRTACELAQGRRRHVTVVHKANVLVETDGLFRRTALEVAREFPEVTVDELLVDTAAMRLVQAPETFDVIVTTNLFGDILSDEAAGLVGGLGLVASANVGDGRGLFEPVHGSAPDIAGRGIANPTAAILASALLLEFLGERVAAERVRAAVLSVLANGPHTPDLGGSATTRQVTQAIMSHLGH
ncbi:MAG: isocitrate/isopropylmalate dehydrogenase family protein [Anaerolineae bacterium]|nr:isocitrate/isopropylmalate dehydrogenase family protein [Anaerolineae bacterium]MDW8098712.1 isocitrate/isopropylmalate dehydrogenase family protein [Anaerolineae bacterium]